MRREDVIPAVVRAVRTLELLGPDRPSLTPTAVAQELEVDSHTAGRLLHTLAVVGLLRRDVLGPHARYFSPTPRLLRLGAGYLARRGWEAAQGCLREIAQTTGAAACLAVLEGGEVVCVAATNPPVAGLVRVYLHPGARLDTTTAPGVVLLADLPADALDAWLDRTTAVADVAATQRRVAHARGGRGFAFAPGGDAWSLAVPVTDANGQAVAALGLVGHQPTPDQLTQQQWHKILTEAADELDSLGGLLPIPSARMAPSDARQRRPSPTAHPQ